ncbi:DUF6212 domain-containing protein [Paracoccus sediminilitoris]|uniref:DUF6212 domain-containing protein n=1 Tax=Paracoccus sediminilitoris TaxID=2202419 RepID=UPI001314A42B|nr:DUF6212 domain-containing protein [Paracoccus sediminilitoris]
MTQQLAPAASPESKSSGLAGKAAAAASLVVSSSELAEVQALNLPVALIASRVLAEEVVFQDEQGVTLSFETVAIRAIGRLALSSAAAGHLRVLGDMWQEVTGAPAPELLAPELLASASADAATLRVSILERLVAGMTAERGASAVRSARFMRELGILRRQHEETQAGFRDLEAFLYRNTSQKRLLDITLSPVAAQPSIVLNGGMQLVQRLPATSIGLSDVSIFVANETAPADGVLHVSLSSPDSGQTLAIWEVPARKLSQGWLRLSMERALGSDAVTVLLRVAYQGTGSVRIASSFQHPEERFQPLLDDRRSPNVPALQIWRWIAGASAPLAATAILPIGGRNRLRRVLGETLTMARDLNNLSQTMTLQPDSSALLVHVLEDRTAGGILSGVALPGARHIYADIRTFHGSANDIEYRIALSPTSDRPSQSGDLPNFKPHLVSEWVRMAPLEDGQVHLVLPNSLDMPCDVYLLTRLPEGVRSNAYGWSTFANLTLQF